MSDNFDEFLPGRDEPGRDIMQDKEGFRRSQQFDEDNGDIGLEDAESVGTNDEERRAFALNTIMVVSEQGIDIDVMLERATRVEAWLRDGQTGQESGAAGSRAGAQGSDVVPGVYGPDHG